MNRTRASLGTRRVESSVSLRASAAVRWTRRAPFDRMRGRALAARRVDLDDPLRGGSADVTVPMNESARRSATFALVALLALAAGCVTKPQHQTKPETFSAFALPDSNRNAPTYGATITRDSLFSATFCGVMNPGTRATRVAVVYFGLPT